MLLTFPKGPVMLDGNEICSDLSILIKPDTWQGRIKFNDPKGEPVDIVVQGCTKPKLMNIGSVETTVFGIEEVKKVPFKLKFEAKIFKEIFKLSGTIKNKEIVIQEKSIVNLILKAIEHTSQI